MIITEKGKEIINDEIEKLKNELKKVREDKASAYIMTGDTWHDNPYFKLVEQKERQILNRMTELYDELKYASQIGINHRNVKEVAIGSIVKCQFTYEGDSDSEEEIFEIVGHGETDAEKNQISYESPVAKSLIGHKVNDTVTFDTPVGRATYTVLEFFSDWAQIDINT